MGHARAPFRLQSESAKEIYSKKRRRERSAFATAWVMLTKKIPTQNERSEL